ncbi:MAG: DUF2330 domain-containing protein [Candidatus Bathyarchaeia archaeon]
MRRTRSLFIGLITLSLIALSLSTSTQPVSADRGLISAPQVSLDESGQNAIVAWNGKEEVLILSTNVRGSESAVVLEMLPLPSNPTKVAEGSLDSFRKLKELMNEKLRAMARKAGGYGLEGVPAGERGVEVTLHEEIGAHDVTVVKVNDLDHFTEWVKEFAEGKGVELSVSSEFRDAVSEYLSRDIRYLVFDVIDVSDAVRSVNPLVYRFETDFLYYPLKITAASNISEQAPSTVNLLLIAKGQVDGALLRDLGFAMRLGFYDSSFVELGKEELDEVSPELADLFEGDPFVMNAHYYGPLTNLNEDLIVRGENLHLPTPFERLSHRISESMFLSYVREGLRLYPLMPIQSSLILLSFIAGVPATIYIMAKLLKRAMRRSPLGPAIQTALSYGLSTSIITFILFSEVREIVIWGLIYLTLAGFATVIFVILKFMSRFSS